MSENVWKVNNNNEKMIEYSNTPCDIKVVLVYED